MKKIEFMLRCLIALFIVVLCYARLIEPNLLMTKNITLNTGGITPKYKVAFFTDTHFGKYYDEENIERIVENINEQDVDLIIFGGDFFDDYSRDKEQLDINYLQNQLSKLTASYGKFAVLGNHDFGGNAYRVSYDLLSNSGFNVLNNENCYIDELDTRIIGFEDAIWGTVNNEFYNIKSTDFNILVSHEPDIVDRITMKNSGVMFSGHTHGGQIFVPFLNQYVLPPLGEIYPKGVYNDVSINKNVSLFVSKGIGTTILPFRFMNVPEVCIITIE